jgi:hypothetical protein
VERVDTNKLLSSVSNVKGALYGLLAGNMNGQFAVGGNQNIAQTLNGKAAIDIRDGRLMNVNLLDQLAAIGKFAGMSNNAENFTKLVQLTGNFNVVNGVASTDNLQAVIEGGKVAASGTANLVDNTLNMKMTAVLSREYAQRAGGQSIGGFMNTALGNNRGELVMPVIVTGTFQNPKIQPDMQRIAQMKLENILPTGQNPAGGVGGALGTLLGGLGGRQQKGEPAQTEQDQDMPQNDQAPPRQAQPQQEEGLGGVLGNIMGAVQEQQKKKKQQQQPPPQQPPQ